MSEVEVRFRQAIPTDAAMIQTMMREMSESSDTVYFDPELIQLSVEQFAHQLEQVYDSTQNLFLLALTDRCIGLLSIQQVDDVLGELGTAVIPDYQGMGIGSILMEEALIWFHEVASLQTIGLSVLPQNKIAKRLYQQAGFHLDQTLRHQLPVLPFETLDYYAYQKERL